MVVGTHRQGPGVVDCSVSLRRWRPSHGEQLWRAKLWWQHRKHGHGLEHPGLSANPSRWSSKKNASLGGSRRHRKPTVSRALLLSLNEAPTGSRNTFRWKISRGSEIIYKRIRNYARQRSKVRRCGTGDSGGAACTQARRWGSAPCAYASARANASYRCACLYRRHQRVMRGGHPSGWPLLCISVFPVVFRGLTASRGHTAR
jgi:hypothetical protein